jgi:hypothetical protein
MAQALAIVGEAGIHGLDYNGLNESWINQSNRWQSRSMRISLFSAHQFSGAEFENYMILAWRWGLVERSKYHEVDWVNGLNKASYQIEPEVIRLTPSGWEFSNKYDQPLLHKWWDNVSSNVPTIALSVGGGVVLAWLLRVMGINE